MMMTDVADEQATLTLYKGEIHDLYRVCEMYELLVNEAAKKGGFDPKDVLGNILTVMPKLKPAAEEVTKSIPESPLRKPRHFGKAG
jgi:hypothetical protein